MRRQKQSVKKQDRYENFVRNNGLSELRKIRSILFDQLIKPIEYPAGALHSFKLYHLQREIVNVFDSSFAYAFMCFKENKSARLPIPRIWLKICQAEGFLIEAKRSYFKITKRTIQQLVRSTYFTCMVFLSKYRQPTNRVNSQRESISIVIGHGKLKTQIADYESFNFANWLAYKFEESKVLFLTEGECIALISNNRQSRPNGALLLRFLRNLTLILSKRILLPFEVLKNLHQIAFYSSIEGLDTHSRNQRIFFTESNSPIQPPWSRYLEDLGVSINFINFSNSSQFRTTKEKAIISSEFRSITWNRVFATTERQKKLFVDSSIVPTPSIEVVGVPWLTDLKSANFGDIQKELEKCLAVFDYGGRYGHFGQSSIMDLGFGDQHSQVSFLDDLIEVCEALGFSIIHKPKRSTSSKSFVKNEYLQERYSESPTYIQVPAELAPYRVIQNCLASISMPPTSTALIAKSLGKPSIYYDHLGFVQDNDPALEEVKLIKGKVNLSEWLKPFMDK